MNTHVEIKTKHLPTIFMMKTDAPDWAKITINRVKEQRDGISEPWTIAIISVALSIPADIIATFLLEKIKNKSSTTITINRKEVNFDKGQIIRVIEETKKIQK